MLLNKFEVGVLLPVLSSVGRAIGCDKSDRAMLWTIMS